MAFRRWKQNRSIIFLGSTRSKRLPIFSFLIAHPASGKILHHDFVAVLLNDLYGIQARGGCACAGPYAQDLLGIDENLAQKFTHFLVDEKDITETTKKKKKTGKDTDCKTCEKTIEIMKPGFTRLNLPFFFSEDAIDYILTAIDRIATDGWMLLPQYQAEPSHAKWSYSTPDDNSPDEKKISSDSLLRATFKGGKFKAPPSPFTQREATRKSFNEMLEDVERVYQEAKEQRLFTVEALTDSIGKAVDNEELIWFLRPHEAASYLRRNNKGDETDTIEPAKEKVASNVPFIPKRYTFRRSFRNSFRKLTRTSKRENYEKMNDKAEGDVDESSDLKIKKRRGKSKCSIM